MAIVQAPQYWKTNIIIMGLIAVLTACGGGGGGNDDDTPPPVSDTTPDSFTFTAVTNADIDAVVESNSITVDGINAAATISITGGEYKVASGDYSTSNSTVTDGQSITVRLTTPEAGNQTREATLLIGGVRATFTVTTRPDDTTPDAFSFAAVTDAAVGSEVTSEAITISGINAAAAISIANGEYSIDGGEFTTDEGVVVEGQSITVRATSSSDLNTPHTVVLTIGGVVGQFEITTLADTTAPVAEFMFPPPVSMTDGNSILVRGVTTDDYSEITSVTVNGVEAQTVDNYETWQVEVPLLAGEDNNLLIQTTDAAGNMSIDEDSKAVVRQGVITDAFPDTNNEFSGVVGIVIDRSANRLITVSGDDPDVMTVDLSTGGRTPFFEPQPFGPSGSIWGIALDQQANELYLKDSSKIRAIPLNEDPVRDINDGNLSYGLVLLLDRLDPELKVISATNWGGEVISTNSMLSEVTIISSSKDAIPDADNPIGTSYGIALDESNARYLVTDADNQRIVSVNRLSGAREIFSDNSIGTGEPFGDIGLAGITGIAIDKENGRAIVTEALSGKIFSIDLLTGNRVLLSGPDIPNTSVAMIESYGIAIHNPSSYVFVSDRVLKAIVAVDLVTGHRVIFSKSDSL